MPMKGWARGDAVLSLALLQELDTLRRQNLEARETLARAEERANAVVPDAAGLDQSCPMSGLYKSSYRGSPIPWSATLSFGEMFALLAPALLEMPVDALVKTVLTKAILERQHVANYTASIDEQPFATFKLQLKALGLVELKYLRTTQGEMGLFWSLTASGMQAMLQLRVVRKGGRDDQHAGRIDEAQRARSAASPRGPVR